MRILQWQTVAFRHYSTLDFAAQSEKKIDAGDCIFLGDIHRIGFEEIAGVVVELADKTSSTDANNIKTGNQFINEVIPL